MFALAQMKMKMKVYEKNPMHGRQKMKLIFFSHSKLKINSDNTLEWYK